MLKGGYPPPINNEVLFSDDKSKINGWVRPNIEYIWLPEDVGKMLWEKYGGVPLLYRSVMKVDGQAQLKLHSYRVDVYHCTKTTKFPNTSSMKTFLLDGHGFLDEVMEEAQKVFNINTPNYSVRCWVKQYGEMLKNIFQPETATPEVVRLLSEEFVNWDQAGYQLYNMKKCEETDLNSLYHVSKGYIELILESHPSGIDFNSPAWPRYGLFNNWKALIRVGDYLDCHLNDLKRQVLNISEATCGVEAQSIDWSSGKVVHVHRDGGKTVITVHILHPICDKSKSCLVGYELPSQNSSIRRLFEHTKAGVIIDYTCHCPFYFTSSTTVVSSSSSSTNAVVITLPIQKINEYISE